MLMASIHRLLRTARPWARRTLGVLVLVLQAALSLSAIWEPRGQVRLGVHAEQQGTRHVGTHNEATCTVCAARLLHAAPTPAVASELSAGPARFVAAIERSAEPSRPGARDRKSVV